MCACREAQLQRVEGGNLHRRTLPQLSRFGIIVAQILVTGPCQGFLTLPFIAKRVPFGIAADIDTAIALVTIIVARPFLNLIRCDQAQQVEPLGDWNFQSVAQVALGLPAIQQRAGLGLASISVRQPAMYSSTADLGGSSAFKVGSLPVVVAAGAACRRRGLVRSVGRR